MEIIHLGIVDDNPHLANQMVNNFSLFDHIKIVLMAKNGIDLLEQLESTEPEIILMDVQMPEMDGIETTQHIVEYFLQKNIEMPHIIGLSANILEKDIEKSMNAGMVDYMTKPFSIEKIVDMIQKWN